MEPRVSGSQQQINQHQISFQRNGHIWRLQWQCGEEETLIDTLAALAGDPDCPLDAFDQALVEKHLRYGPK
ncbi:MAG: hypothetical protein QGI75_01205 [Phycisphaerales bacterium]|nr:hypothetical protein [Phycisphaerales bacterium]MDP6890475.1 hypothetical protein [Phycisphaerales bacterium]